MPDPHACVLVPQRTAVEPESTMDSFDRGLVHLLYTWATSTSVTQTLCTVVAQWAIFAIPLLLAVAWWWPQADRAVRRTYLLGSAVTVLLSGLVAEALALVVDRPRPFVVLDLPPVFPHSLDSSFPSDHTILGVALAAPLVWGMARFGLPLLALALTVGTARVAAGVHWPTDIVGSAVLALALGWVALPLTNALVRRVPAPFALAVGLPHPIPAPAAGAGVLSAAPPDTAG